MSVKTRNQIRRRKLAVQKVLGFALIIVCIVVVLMAFTAKTSADKDITAMFVLAPIGIYLMSTKSVVVY